MRHLPEVELNQVIINNLTYSSQEHKSHQYILTVQGIGH